LVGIQVGIDGTAELAESFSQTPDDEIDTR
jgi:hypothetical protein